MIRPARAILMAVKGRAHALWERPPRGRIEVLLLWALGLALGALGAWASLCWPLPAALAGWAAVVALGLLFAMRAEPVLWEESGSARSDLESDRKPGPARAPERPRVRPLLDMVEIPGGTFRMGSPPATEEQIAAYAREWAEALDKTPDEVTDRVRRWLEDEQPAHPVRLSPFLMATVPVTRGQWRAVMADAPEEWGRFRRKNRLPATHVDWPQALAFCNALSEREGLTPCYRQDDQGAWQWDRAADGYRLPTEAEWEHACRAGTQTRWHWGEDPQDADAHAWYRGNSGQKLQRVGRKAANPWGLYDMTGLVYEWCWDRFGPYPSEHQEAAMDPGGPTEGDARVVRGGSFMRPPGVLRSAFRALGGPDGRSDRLGLRCVRSRVRQP